MDLGKATDKATTYSDPTKTESSPKTHAPEAWGNRIVFYNTERYELTSKLTLYVEKRLN